MRGVKVLVAVVVVALLGASAAFAATAFDDVPEGAFYDEPTAWAVEQGLTVGCDRAAGQEVSDTFCPLANVTRGENITFTYRHQTLVIDPLLDEIRGEIDALEETLATNTGPQGPEGPKGDTGDTGPQGPAGADGSDGPVDGSPCSAGGDTGTVVSGFDATGDFYVKCFTEAAGSVTTIAGTGSSGNVDGLGTTAQFSFPNGVAVDAAGNVYVADEGNDKIRKITPAGIVTTLAGSVSSGADDGLGTAAQFDGPNGVAVDAAGNVYVADTMNERIRKITPAGEVTTFAGSGVGGSDDGTGTAATFDGPFGVAVDAAGNVYVADSGSNKIRKITPAGVVTTLAGSGVQGSDDGTGTAATFDAPTGVAVDAAGNVYVADSGSNKIRKITPAGVVTTLAGSGLSGSDDGTGTAATFDDPYGVAVDGAGNVYVADTGSRKIRKITPAGVVTTLAGSGVAGFDDGTGIAATFNNPSGIAVDAAGNVYVAEFDNNAIRRID